MPEGRSVRTRDVLGSTTLALLLIAGCGRGSSAAEPAPPSPEPTDVSDHEEPAVSLAALDSSIPIFESISTPSTGKPAGYRLWADGRYEHLRAGLDHGDEWYLVETLSDAEVTAFREAITGLGLDQLQPRYKPEYAVRDAGRTEWRIQVGGELVQVEVISRAQVPELTALDRAFVDAHVQPEVTIAVTALASGSEQKADVPCPPNSIDDLGAAFMAMVRAQTGTGPLAVEGEPQQLFQVVWHTDGEESGRHELWSDGRMVRTLVKENDVREAYLSAAEMDGVRAALDVVDWATLSTRCPEE